MSSNSITNSLNSNSSNRKQQLDNGFQYDQFSKSNQSSLEQTRSTNCQNYLNENQLPNNYANEPNRTTSVRTSFSFASTSSSDSGCNVNTSSMDASVLSANNFMNESLMSCSIMTSNSLVDDDEQILTISHNNGTEQMVANQMNVKHYIQQQQMNTAQNRPFIDTSSTGNLPLSATLDDFGEMSSRAESQLSAIYQQIDELKSKIDEIDLDNGRIEAKMNSLVNFNHSSKVNLGAKKASFNYSFNDDSFDGNFRPTASSSAIKAAYQTATSNSSEEEIVTSSSYSPASSSSLASSPTSIQNSSTFTRMNDSLPQTDKQQQHSSNMTSSASFNSTSTTIPSSCWSLASICSSQNVPAALATKVERNSLNMSTIDEHKAVTMTDPVQSDGEPLERVFSYLKQNDPTRLYTQLKHANGPNIHKLLLSSRRRSLNSKFVDARRSFVDQHSSDLNSSNSFNRLSNGSLKGGCNEAWVSTTTDLLVSSDDEETLNYVNYVNNQMKSKKLDIKSSEEISHERVHAYDKDEDTRECTVRPASNSEFNHSKPMLLSNCTSYNSDKDAFKFSRQYNNDERKHTGRSQIPKPLTPIKVNDNYKRLKPTNGSKIPVMRPIIEIEFDSPTNHPPSPAPLDRQVNRITDPIKNRNLPKPKAFLFNKKANYSDCLVSPLTQQLKFEKQEQRKLGGSFRRSNNDQPPNWNYGKPNNQQVSNYNRMNYQQTAELLSPPLSSDSGLSELTHSEESHSDNSPLVEQAKNQTLAYQIQNLRLELRDVIKVAINEVRKDDLF